MVGEPLVIKYGKPKNYGITEQMISKLPDRSFLGGLLFYNTKELFMKKYAIAGIICGIMSQPAFAANSGSIHPFIGGELGMSVHMQDSDIAEEYGIPYSTFSARNPNFLYGANAGIRFLDNSYIYRPGFQLFYNRITGSANLNVATGYGSIDYDIDTAHNLIGGEFDNYLRVAHNESCEFFDSRCDNFIVLGLDWGKIKSTYTITDTDDDIKDDGNFYGVKLEWLTETKNGLGVTVNMKLLKTDTEALPTLLVTKFGLRYTF